MTLTDANDLPTQTTSDLRDRMRRLNDLPLTSAPRGETARYVLCWVQQTLRAEDNPLIDAAISIANAMDLPVLVYHGVRADYPHASDRLHDFLLKGSRDLQQGCEARGLRCVNYVETEDLRESGLVYRLAEDAALVLTDDQPTYVARWQAERFAKSCKRCVIVVDTARLVPTRMLPLGLNSTKAFRAANGELRDHYASAERDLSPICAPYDGALDFTPANLGAVDDAGIAALNATCPIDHTLCPHANYPASRAVATDRLARFVSQDLARYKWTRNNPAEDGSGSHLSPYLHFGLLGPRELFAAVKAADVHAAARWKFLDEAITWREWFHYQAFHDANFDQYDSLPARARDTLDAHADDPREQLYSLADLLHGRTEDETWNAAQRCWLTTGYLHNNLRMYWGKKLIGWTGSPRAAWATACYLNDRISLDGRDPATYGNLQWCFGHARPSSRDQSVYGRVTKKSDTSVRKRKGVPDWLADWAQQETSELPTPDQLNRYGFEGEV